MTLQAPAQRGVLRRKRLVPVAPAPGVDGRERPSPTRTPCLVSQPPTTAPGALPAQREAQEVEGGRPFPALLVRRRSPKVQQPSFVRMESRPLALQPLRQQRLHPLGVLPPLAAADESSSLGVQFPQATRLVILWRSRADAERALGLVQTWVEANGLKLHPTKTRIVEAATESFSFLGYEFRGRLRLPRPQSLAQLKDQVRPQTRRTSGDSLACIIARLNQTLRGWFEYFGHCSPTVYPDLDSWVRGRLRGLLRQRQGQPGRGRGADHQRWSNAYFAEPGLYSLSATHVRWCQSPSG